MREQLRALVKLSEIDARARGVDEQLKGIPAELEERRGAVRALESLVSRQTAAIVEAEKLVGQQDADLASRNDLLGKSKAKGAKARTMRESDAAERELESISAGSGACALISVHSFTPQFGGRLRPWHCGVLWDLDGRMACPLRDALRTEPGLVVGDNEPYSGRHPANHTIDAHATRRGWPHVCIEVRQDLLGTAAGVQAWVARLGGPLETLLADDRLYRASGDDDHRHG